MKARLRRLVDSNVIGIIFWNERGEIKEANEAFLRMLGFTRDELLSGAISWRDLTPPEHRIVDQRAIDEIMATGKCPPYEKEYFAKDGTRVPVLIGAAAIRCVARKARSKALRSSSTCASRFGYEMRWISS